MKRGDNPNIKRHREISHRLSTAFILKLLSFSVMVCGIVPHQIYVHIYTAHHAIHKM
jgi:hypothetical protein